MPALFAFGTGAADTYSQIKREERAGVAEKDKEKRVLADQITLLNERSRVEDELRQKREDEATDRSFNGFFKTAAFPEEYREPMREDWRGYSPSMRDALLKEGLGGRINVRRMASEGTPDQVLTSPEGGTEIIPGIPPSKGAFSSNRGGRSLFEIVVEGKDPTKDRRVGRVVDRIISFQGEGYSDSQIKGLVTPAEWKLYEQAVGYEDSRIKLVDQWRSEWNTMFQNIMDVKSKVPFPEWIQKIKGDRAVQMIKDYEESMGLKPGSVSALETAPIPNIVVGNQMKGQFPSPKPEPVVPPSANTNIFTGGNTREGNVVASDSTGATEVRRVEPNRSPRRPNLFDLGPKPTPEQKAEQDRKLKGGPLGLEGEVGVEERMVRSGISPEKIPVIQEQIKNYTNSAPEAKKATEEELRKRVKLAKEQNAVAVLNNLRGFAIGANLNLKEFGL